MLVGNQMKILLSKKQRIQMADFQLALQEFSDGSLLFLQHLIHKMEPSGSRIGIVFNGSPLFSGDAGSGE